MRLSIIFILTILMTSSIVFAQDDSLKVAKEDWNYIQETTKELEQALDDCDTLNTMYEQRMSLFQMEVSDLTQANMLCDSIVTKKDEQLEMRKEQIALLNRKIQKQNLELWVTRGGGLILVVAAVLLLK